ncbi:hypothetical protein [Sanguibacter sp. 25GB23B1]|uniref:hypothetical protein n=1 Tax=unclassified Sanguibacter TaxID=2645534 RepID=UPI0032AFAB8D
MLTATTPRGTRTPGQRISLRRIPIFLAALLCLLAALWGGLLLLGLPLPTLVSTTASDHGPLITLGFLGTVISLERSVALGKAWGFSAPAASGAGGLALLLGQPMAGRLLLCLAAVLLLVVYVVVHRIQPALHLRVMAVGALCWYVATVLWLAGWPVPRMVPWLAGFLVLTILGERLELARVGMLRPAAVRQFTAAGWLFVAGLVLTTVAPATTTLGTRLAGAGMLALALWGASNDVARRTVRVPGVTRFMAVCLLAGYVWLAIGGTIWFVAGDLGSSLQVYDAALHAVFLGFVMSMIFGHAPVIVPAVLRVRLPFHVSFYAHVVLLHVALAVRLVAGDALGSPAWWRGGGIATEVAVVLFLVVSATAAVRAGRTVRTR